LTTNVEERAAACVLHVAGEIDLSTIGELEAAIAHAEDLLVAHGRRPGTVVIDLGEVTFLGAEGLRGLVAAENRRAEAGGSLRVVAPGGGNMIRRLLDLSGVGALLDLYETVAEALPDGG
jgi:anti-sigma B factor antagonist